MGYTYIATQIFHWRSVGLVWLHVFNLIMMDMATRQVRSKVSCPLFGAGKPHARQ